MRLSGQAIIIAVFNFVISLSGIISSMILSRQLLVKDYGTYKQIWLIFNTLSPLIILGTQTSVPFFIKKWHESKEKKVLFLAGFIVSVSSFLAGLLLYFNAVYIGHYFNNEEIIPIIKIFCIYPLLVLSISCKEVYFISKGRPYLASISTMVSTLLLLSASVIPTLHQQNLVVTFQWIVISGIVQYLFYLILFIIYKFKLPIIPDKNECIEFSKLSFTIGIGYLVQLFAILTDKYVISYFFTPVEFALYSNGSIQVPFVAIITTSIMSVLFPKMVELHKNKRIPDLLNYWNEAACKSSMVLYPIFIFCFIMAKELMIFLFGKNYVSSSSIFQIYLFLFIFRNINYSSIMLVFQDLRFYLMTSFLYLVVNFISNILLVKWIGLSGPAWATVITTIFLIMLILKRNAHLLLIPFNQTLPFKRLLTIFMVAFICGIIVYGIRWFWYDNIHPFVLIAVSLSLYSMCYLSILLKLKFITTQDLNIIKYIR